MSQTKALSEISDNFPAFFHQTIDKDTPVVITNRNRPRAVLVPWDVYQDQQTLQSDGAEYRLQKLVQQMLGLVAVMHEAYRPDSYDLIKGTKDLLDLARQAWDTCRLLDMNRRHLASSIADGVLLWLETESVLTLEQLVKLLQIIPLLQKTDLTLDEFADADQALADVGLDSIFPVGD
ncbi:MAG: type II toxin-antitoxin system Phd/YefM family antitoxin, partial [Chloroflexota bacterium]